MNAADSLYAGFADHFIAEDQFDVLKQALIAAGDTAPITDFATPPDQPGKLALWQKTCDHILSDNDVRMLADAHFAESEMDKFWQKALAHNAPLSMLCTAEILHRLTPEDDIETALDLEYRFTYRSMQEGEFLEGTRAAVIDKDRKPNWRYKTMAEISDTQIGNMLAELPKNR